MISASPAGAVRVVEAVDAAQRPRTCGRVSGSAPFHRLRVCAGCGGLYDVVKGWPKHTKSHYGTHACMAENGRPK